MHFIRPLVFLCIFHFLKPLFRLEECIDDELRNLFSQAISFAKRGAAAEQAEMTNCATFLVWLFHPRKTMQQQPDKHFTSSRIIEVQNLRQDVTQCHHLIWGAILYKLELFQKGLFPFLCLLNWNLYVNCN
jgi:hypothetical protein